MEKQYQVIWIDDQWEELISFDTRAEQNNINLTPFKTSAEGMAELEKDTDKWDAVILDAKVYRNSTNETASLSGLFASISKLEQLSSKRIIPWFVLTGQPDLVSNETLQIQLEEKGKRIFSKYGSDDVDILFKELKEQADCQLETQIRHEYSNVFDVCTQEYIGDQNSSRLLKILLSIKLLDNQNPIHFNSIRKITEDIFDKLDKLGVLPREHEREGKVEKMSFNGKGRFLTNSNKVPTYIQRSIQSIVSTTQDASHSRVNTQTELKTNNLQVDIDVQSGRSPYLLFSTVYELLNLIYWLKGFVDENQDIEKNKALFQRVLISKTDTPEKDRSPKIQLKKVNENREIKESESIDKIETLTGEITTKLPGMAIFTPNDNSDSIRIEGSLLSKYVLEVGMLVTAKVKVQTISNKITRQIFEIELCKYEDVLDVNFVNIPDLNFKKYLVKHFDIDGDSEISIEEALSIKEINLIGKYADASHLAEGLNIHSLEGIEFFQNLTNLDCIYNPIKSLDLSKNKLLTYLTCNRNYTLEEINISNCTELKYLSIYDTNLSKLDITKNIQLIDLYCGNSKIRILDVRNNLALRGLSCKSNLLETIDVSKNTLLEYFHIAYNNLTILDVSKNIKLKRFYCDNNKLLNLDISKNVELEIFCFKSVTLNTVDISLNPKLQKIELN